MVLNYTAGSTNLIGDGSALVLGGNGTASQPVNNVTVTMTGAVANETIASIAVNANNTANVVLGSANEKLTITSPTVTLGANSYLNFNTTAGGANGSTNTLGTGIVAWAPTLTNGIINPGITVTDAGGTGFATVVAGDVVRLGGTSLTLLPPSGATTANNYLVDNNTGGPSAPGSNSLQLSADEGTSTISVDTSARSGALDLNGHVLTSNGWTLSGSNNYQITNTGAATAALKSSTVNTSIFLNNYGSGGLNIGVNILANGTSGSRHQRHRHHHLQRPCQQQHLHRQHGRQRREHCRGH